MQTAPIYNYTIEQNSTHSVITYKKSPVSLQVIGPISVYTAIPGILLTFMMGKPDSVIEFFIKWILITLALSYGIYLLINLLRRPGQFGISSTAILYNGQSYDLQHISSIGLKDASNMYLETSTVYYTQSSFGSLAGSVSNLSNSMRAAGAQSRMAIQHHVKNVSYKIYIRFGSKDINIASGMDEASADVLLNKICELTGYKIK